jgi:hypothetical protein
MSQIFAAPIILRKVFELEFAGKEWEFAQELFIFAPMQTSQSQFAWARILVRQCDFQADLIFSKRNAFDVTPLRVPACLLLGRRGPRLPMS